MPHKFAVGEWVDYWPARSKIRGRYKVVRQMPEEFQASDLKYRIKSDEEGFERNVLECDLSPSIVPESAFEPVKPQRRGSRA